MRKPEVMSLASGSEPEGAFISQYSTTLGGYSDCYYIDIQKDVALSDYILAFFSTPIFRMERLILNLVPSGRSNEQCVLDLAAGTGDKIAGWKTEKRDDSQLLLAVGDGPIRTWLMVQGSPYSETTTRLYFGSAVLPTGMTKEGHPKLAIVFRLFAGLHIFYSRLLLWWAARDLGRKSRSRHSLTEEDTNVRPN
ncbi:MAG: hypothetical protein HRU27_06805 [Rhizobiaceae bacterium]|nr:hypothetical protein [Rhizobiaceae bacterium]